MSDDDDQSSRNAVTELYRKERGRIPDEFKAVCVRHGKHTMHPHRATRSG
jgi:hypothetical protein